MVHFLYELKRLNYYIFSLTKEQPLPTKSKQTQQKHNNLILKLYFIESFIAFMPNQRQQRVTLTHQTVNLPMRPIYAKRGSKNAKPNQK